MTSSRTLLLLSVISAMMSLIRAQRTPTISYVTPNISTTRSSTIDMDCSVLWATEYPILWMKIDEQGHPIPLARGPSLIIRDHRFAMRYDTASATYTLQLKDVQRSDEGRYECQIIVAINNKVTQSLFLRVQEPPVINDNSTRSVVVSEFEPALLECTATGSPPPRIEWRRADNAVLPTGGVVYRGQSFKIHSVKREDRGTYFCVADNGVGKAKKRHVALQVEFQPNFVEEEENAVVSQAFGYSVTLVCAVEAFPPADISWSHQSILKSDNEDNLSIDNGRSEADDNKSVYRGILGSDGFTSSTLRVNRLRPGDLGAYTCTANNKLGRTRHIITIEQSWSPNCEQDCEWEDEFVSGGAQGLGLSVVMVTIIPAILCLSRSQL